MRIVLLGSRGVPVKHGYRERLAEELSTRLVRKGHEVTVYCSRPYARGDEEVYRGVRRVFLPSLRAPRLEDPVRSILSLLSAGLRRADVVFILGAGSAPLCLFPRLTAKKIAIFIEGRGGPMGRETPVKAAYFRLAARAAGVFADAVTVPARWVREELKRKHDLDAMYIPYGTDAARHQAPEILKKLGLDPDGYILSLGGLASDSGSSMLKEAFGGIEEPQKKLVIVGDHRATEAEVRHPRIISAGAVYGDAYQALLANAYCFVQADEEGMAAPAVVDAMAAGRCVLAGDVPAYREVLRDSGTYFRGADDLRRRLSVLMKVEALVREKGAAAAKIAAEEYRWDAVAEAYGNFFAELFEKKRQQKPLSVRLRDATSGVAAGLKKRLKIGKR